MNETKMFGPEKIKPAAPEQTIGSKPENLKLESLPTEEQEKLKQSWIKIEEILANIDKISFKEADVSKVESEDKEKLQTTSQEIYDFYGKLFEGEENADPMQIQIGIENGFVDTYVGRDAEGKMASILQSERVEIPPTKEGERPGLMFLVWYVATDKEYKGKPLTRDLFKLAMQDLLEKSKKELKPVKVFAGETEDEVEGMFNRYGLNRLYYKNKQGETMEVPFECPPEDESSQGVPEHLMLRMLDDKKTISKEELLGVVDSIYGEYTKSEYFSVDYLKYAQEFYKEDLDAVEANVPINSVTANVYYRNYKRIVSGIRKKLEKSLKKADGELFFKSRRDRRQEGTIVANDWEEEDDEK